MSNETSRRGSNVYNEKEMLFNGFVVSNMTNLENRTYTAISVPNSIKSKRNRKIKQESVLARFQQLDREEITTGFETEDGTVVTAVPDLSEQGSSQKTRYKEMMSARDENKFGDELSQANNRLLEEENMDTAENGNPFFKSECIIIYPLTGSYRATFCYFFDK